MRTVYQLVLLGKVTALNNQAGKIFKKRVKELGLPSDSIRIIYPSDFDAVYSRSSPSVCLYFGDHDLLALSSHLPFLKVLWEDAVLILPVVSNLLKFKSLIPSELHNINGFELKDYTGLEGLVNRILEGFSLLRISRRLFISYKRDESTELAMQLYEHLDSAGFDVFLDTHSVLPGDKFQDELWHRLVDTDVVILLNSPNFFKSKWTREELAKASAMSIGVVQLIYPDVIPKKYASLCFPIYLEKEDFRRKISNSKNAKLIKRTIKRIAREIEAVRAASLASRQNRLIQEFTATAAKHKHSTAIQPERFITLIKSDGSRLDVIPTVGVPQSLNFNQIEELVELIRKSKTPKPFLLYDHRNILEKWESHLQWLNLHVPVKAIQVTNLDKWMTTSVK
jgi:TIR domain-containing protein